jgi:hypothetical protein
MLSRQQGRCIRSNRGPLATLGMAAPLFLWAHLSVAAADTTQLKVGDSLSRFNLIQPGVHRYLRYKVKDDRRSAMDIWSRKITFEEKDGRRLMHIVQRWDEISDQAAPPFFLIQDSWFEPGTFRPLTHIRHREHDGKVEISGYRFLPDKIVGIADLPDNLRKDFSIASPEPSYNFEYDMELLQVLPLRNGYEASIPFYDAGFDPPARYNFAVAGSAVVAGPDGHLIECWIVTADYNTGKVVSKFWFDKRTQVLIREEQAQEDGSFLVKTLLNPESADAVEHTRS